MVAIIFAMLLALTQGRLGLLAEVFGQGSWSQHLPDWKPLADAGPVIWLHLATVGGAFVIGIVLLVGPKGRRLHRTLGWIWTGFMVATAIDTLFIHAPGVGPTAFGFSPLHLFSVWVLITAPLAVYFARRHKVARHRSMMTGLFFGGLVLTGMASFFPGRIMHAVLFG